MLSFTLYQEITEIELVRVENGIIGPHEELKFWKKQMTRFNCLVNQLKQKYVVNILLILKIARSKALDVFFDYSNKL